MENKNKGITLIALIITIIVLLIISLVTINAITGSESVLDKASKAKEESYKGRVKDDVELALMNSFNNNTGRYDESIMQDNIRNIKGFSGDISKDEEKNEYSFTIDGYQVKIDKDRKTLIDGEYAGESLGGNSGGEEKTTVSTEIIYDRGTFGEGWEFYTSHNGASSGYGNNQPIINEDNYDLNGSSYRVLYTKKLDLEQYTKAFFVVDNVNTIGRIFIAESPERINDANIYYKCNNDNTIITQQEDGSYLIEWNIESIIGGKIAMDAWNSDGSRKVYKMYLEKTIKPKEQIMIYNYGTTSNGYTLSSEHDYSGKGQVIVNEDNYELKSGSNYSILYTNDIDFSNYDYFCTEINNVNTLDRIALRKDPFEVNHGQPELLNCSNAKNGGQVYIKQLEDGRYFMKVNIKDVNGIGSINYNAWNGNGDRKVYKIWLEKYK